MSAVANEPSDGGDGKTKTAAIGEVGAKRKQCVSPPAFKNEMLDTGRSVRIPRTDGSIQTACVVKYDAATYELYVEWYEGDASRGKWVPVAHILPLNPQYLVPVLDKTSTTASSPAAASNDNAQHLAKASTASIRFRCARCSKEYVRKAPYLQHVSANTCKVKRGRIAKKKNKQSNAVPHSDAAAVVIQADYQLDDYDNEDGAANSRRDTIKPAPLVTDSGNDNPTKCPHDGCAKLCKGVRGLSQHIRCCHTDVARTRLIAAAPHAVPASQQKLDAVIQLENDRKTIYEKFVSKLLAVKRAVEIDPGTSNDNHWTQFETIYKDYVCHLLSLQPQFYSSPKRKKTNRKGKQRRSIEEVDAAREAFKFREAQFNFHNDMRKLRRHIFGAEPDPARFSSNELYEYYNNVFGQVNDKIAPIEQMPFCVNNDEQRDVDVVMNEQQHQILPAEVLKALRGLSNEVAAGPDRLRVKTIKTYDNEGKILALIFSICFTCKRVPVDWTRGSTSILPKPRKDALLLENRRPITIVSIIRRLYSRVINLRMSPYTRIHEAQKGFRGGFGLIENVHLVRELIAHAKAEDRTLYIISYDAVKAFDSVGHAHLFTAMTRMGIPSDTIDAVKSLYHGFSTQVVHKETRTRPVQVLRGVLQGCPCSPTLFNVAVNFVIDSIHKQFLNRGYAVDDDTEIVSCAFADDLLVCSGNWNDAAEMCTELVKWLKNIGLEMNMNKSNAIIINDSIENIARFRSTVPVNVVDDDELVRYLGADISAAATPHFSELAAKVAHECQSVIDYKYLRLMQQLQVFDSSTVSKLVYPAQAYCTGTMTANGGRQPLVKNLIFRQMCDVMWDAQTEIVGLWPSSPKNFMRGDTGRRCLGLREPRWVVCNNAATSANTLRNSTDKRVTAINKANHLDFDDLIAENIKLAISVLGSSSTTTHLRLQSDDAAAKANPEAAELAGGADDVETYADGALAVVSESLPLSVALENIVDDDKKMKAQRLTIALRTAAAGCWQRSTSGQLAGTNVSEQVLNANSWRRMYERSSDGAIRLAIKLMGEQHSLRCRGGGFISKASGENDLCRGCRIPGQRETTQHVLGGSCVGTNRMAIDRHDTVQHYIAKVINHPVNDNVTNVLWRVTENPPFSSKYQHNKPDMLVESADGRSCYLLDPTIGFETNDAAVDNALQEKSRKYEPLVAELKSRGFKNVGVTGLWFGARGILHRPTIEFLTKTFGIDVKRLYPIAEITMNYTAYIYQRVIGDSLCAKGNRH